MYFLNQIIRHFRSSFLQKYRCSSALKVDHPIYTEAATIDSGPVIERKVITGQVAPCVSGSLVYMHNYSITLLKGNYCTISCYKKDL